MSILIDREIEIYIDISHWLCTLTNTDFSTESAPKGTEYQG